MSDSTREFIRSGITTETKYVDNLIGTNAMCYKVSAVDRSGNEGELSEAICLDNCLNYELPNVFTSNNDDCNDLFSAYNNRSSSEGEEGSDNKGLCPDDSPGKIANRHRCARFVERVVFKVYNRWGKEVYTYQSGNEKTIYIDWDGRDKDDSELATGVYYYIAEVTFFTSDPAKRNQTLKGWVHLLR